MVDFPSSLAGKWETAFLHSFAQNVLSLINSPKFKGALDNFCLISNLEKKLRFFYDWMCYRMICMYAKFYLHPQFLSREIMSSV